MRTGLTKDLIARVLGGAAKYTLAQLEEMYPPREFGSGGCLSQTDLSKGDFGTKSPHQDSPMVTRFAPSPTGFMHIGGLYQMLINYKLAKQSSGISILRIEDTDTKREVADAVKIIYATEERFGLKFNEREKIVFPGDEDRSPGEKEHGAYGPYFQSKRKDIYHSIAAELLQSGRAYPCFLSPAEMEEIRENQKSCGLPTGIYGEFAKWRDADESEITARLDAGEVPSIRLYSNGEPSRKIYCKDVVRGSIAFPENNEDIVLIKSNDGLPTYHFAHLCDDHFMRTTNVVRGEEWLPSFPLHIQLFNMMNWNPPAYIHTSTLDKIDTETGKQRKLSKRKDPEANVLQFIQDGWPTEAVLEYLFNIVASGYEEAKAKGLVKNIWEYELRPKKIPTSGALFDMKKLEWWAKEFIATLSVDQLVSRVIAWAREYSPEWAKRIGADAPAARAGVDAFEYLRAILAIERDNPKRIRKDFITWKQTLEEISYFFDDYFAKDKRTEGQMGNDLLSICPFVLKEFLQSYNYSDDKDTWWNKIKDIAAAQNIAPGDAAMALRVALTGRTNTPDLYSIMQVMGSERVIKRLKTL
ncbi:MAG: glutamate--tRNA ligase [Rickettsiales bacterium]|jgi:glutamyl-tRNA synthetase|nr:glutamate--tRNA ligase [Rickettsiales bacterium]